MHEQSSTEITNTTSWYALKVFYNRVAKIETLLKGRNIESYIPMQSIEQVVAGRKVRRRKPAISSLMFMRCGETEATELQKELMGEVMVYRNRGERQPAAIPDSEMQMFIRVTSIDDLGLEYLGEASKEWATGDKVRVTGGIFQGTEGYIKRIKGNHRLVVAIEGIIAVATSYIPTCFLEKAE
jgi:transcription antitermination factor NusG